MRKRNWRQLKCVILNQMMSAEGLGFQRFIFILQLAKSAKGIKGERS